MKNLIDRNKNAYHYQEEIQNKFQSICEPLYKLGFKWFAYIKIFPDGSYLVASPGHREHIRQFCFNIQYQGIDTTRAIESAPFEKSNYVFYSSDNCFLNQEKNPVLNLLYSFGLWPVFIIIKKRLKFIEAYNFVINTNNQNPINFYFNNLDILENFCNYFDDRATDIINCSDKQKLGYLEQKFNLQNQSKEIFRAQQIKQFFQETYIKQLDKKKREIEFFSSREGMEGLNYLALGESVKEISGNLGIPSLLIEKSLQTFKELSKPQLNTTGGTKSTFLSLSLSPRQKECLFLLTRGKTAKQIGQALGISHRTVETHIISLKNKMNCTTKDQLIEKVFDSNKIDR